MPTFEILLIETIKTAFKLEADDSNHAEELAGEMAEERSFPGVVREHADREITAREICAAGRGLEYPVAPSDEEVARREALAAAKRMSPAAVVEFLAVVETTIAALQQQPFAVQVACGLDALTAELLILRGEG